jgi:hypothetical protein
LIFIDSIVFRSGRGTASAPSILPGLIAAGNAALVDRYVGYYKPYATSHDDLDHDQGFQTKRVTQRGA